MICVRNYASKVLRNFEIVIQIGKTLKETFGNQLYASNVFRGQAFSDKFNGCLKDIT